MATTPIVAELQALILQVQAHVQALENAAAAAATVAPGATTTTATPSVVVFADTPQTLSAEDLIDYLSKRGSEIYKQGIAALDDKSLTDGFNMTVNQTVVFTEAFLSRAIAMGWNKGSKRITTFTNSSGVPVNIIKSYGQIDEATLICPPHVQDNYVTRHHQQCHHHPNVAGQPAEFGHVCSDSQR